DETGTCNPELDDPTKRNELLSADGLQSLSQRINQMKLIDGRFDSKLARAIVDPRTLWPKSNEMNAASSLYESLFSDDSTVGQVRRELSAMTNVRQTELLNLHAYFEAADFREVVQYFADCNDARLALIQQHATYDGPYIKTPNVVVSWHNDLFGRIFQTGGHNLSSKTTSILQNPAIPKGKIKLEWDVVTLSPEDSAGSGAVARFLERNRGTYDLRTVDGRGQMIARLEALIKETPRTVEPMPRALSIDTTVASVERGLQPSHLPTNARFIGWRGNSPSPEQIASLSREAQQAGADIYLAKQEGGYIVFHASGKPPTFYNTHFAADAQLKTQALVLKTAAAQTDRSGNVVVATSSSVPRGEVEGIKLRASARSAAAGAGAGDGGRGGFFEFLEPNREPGRGNQFWYQSARRDKLDSHRLQLFGKDSAHLRKTLVRTDADWQRARVEELPTESLANGSERIGQKITVPFTVADD